MADCEIIQLQKNRFLSISTDSIAIEIHSGLYRDPETWGYLAVANSASDLATTGAKPLGMLISAQWKKEHGSFVKTKVYAAMAKALKKFHIPLLGGDSGSSSETVITTTILGESSVSPLTRQGVQPGDLILCFGRLIGIGPALAYDYLKYKSINQWEKKFRPYPDWRIVYKFMKYFKASIDSSDGIYSALETLATINSVQFEICDNDLVLSTSVKTYQSKNKIPMKYFIESDLGDLQTCVAIHPRVYARIKRQLPFHQIMAIAKKKNVFNDTAICYAQKKPIAHYQSLPTILERNGLKYSAALNQWLSQFEKSL